jgi:hypothetical protein
MEELDMILKIARQRASKKWTLMDGFDSITISEVVNKENAYGDYEFYDTSTIKCVVFRCAKPNQDIPDEIAIDTGAYILNDSGKTIEAIRVPQEINIEPKEDDEGESSSSSTTTTSIATSTKDKGLKIGLENEEW